MSPEAREIAAIACRAAATARSARPAMVEQKSFQDFVTDMDRRLEAEITAALETVFPGVPVHGEESIGDNDRIAGSAFMVDPLDGTSNWIAGLPLCAVSIAQMEAGRTVLAAVADIWHGTVYVAAEGQGAFRNEARLATPAPSSALMCLSTGLLDASADGALFRAMRPFGKLRNLGSQALQLCAVADGALVLDASLEARLWDDAAGRLIVTEAGARYAAAVAPEEADRPAARQRSLAAHPAIFEEAERLLRPIFSRSAAR